MKQPTYRRLSDAYYRLSRKAKRLELIAAAAEGRDFLEGYFDLDIEVTAQPTQGVWGWQ